MEEETQREREREGKRREKVGESAVCDTDTKTYHKIDKGEREIHSDILGLDVRPKSVRVFGGE